MEDKEITLIKRDDIDNVSYTLITTHVASLMAKRDLRLQTKERIYKHLGDKQYYYVHGKTEEEITEGDNYSKCRENNLH